MLRAAGGCGSPGSQLVRLAASTLLYTTLALPSNIPLVPQSAPRKHGGTLDAGWLDGGGWLDGWMLAGCLPGL
ncbi:hypothetical protein BZA05DRAFT_402153 [Tricharina praecox]|uniref:uncharacterized protein n=1 Tax=Tricharina praecox TaxID=43433 RepID=UPI002220E20B|nr:uncharacterized protein BZA05DRAFT_402153 [Tricharina praecox]KAI5849082.1 hypothetical protein BZA05DRAFT_402153 [Tricharina praecox]